MNSTRTTPMMPEVLSMANKGPDTNRSQFFWTFAPQPHLNDKYSVFGHLVDGFETLDALRELPVGKKHARYRSDHGRGHDPREPVRRAGLIRQPDGAVTMTAVCVVICTRTALW